jgi:aminopeptidase YwaD
METIHPPALAATIERYLHALCVAIPHRHVGSAANQQATTFFAQTMAAAGFATESPSFSCIDWAHGSVHLEAGGTHVDAIVNPYSLPCTVQAPLVTAATLDELIGCDCTGKLLLLHGDLTREQLMPKNFVFYNPAAHQQIIALLEQHQPAAIIAATGHNPEMAGGWYPFPLFEDGDFDLPSVSLTESDGEKLRAHAGDVVSLAFESQRIPSVGCNVVARKPGTSDKRVVVCAHIDSKLTTPGALDNAAGVATLLALADLLRDDSGRLTVELVALNGEDYYAASGQMRYMQDNQDRWDDIVVAINMDLAGYRAGRTAWSSYDCPAHINALLHEILAPADGFLAGPPWYQSDHSMFLQQQCPAIAFTSEHIAYLCTHITHTAHDTIDLVDSHKLATIAGALARLVRRLNAEEQA